MQECCVIVVVVHDVFHRIVAEFVGFTVNIASLHTTTCQPHAEAIRVVVASDVLFVLDHREPSHLTASGPQSLRSPAFSLDAVAQFRDELEFRYLGDWSNHDGNSLIEPGFDRFPTEQRTGKKPAKCLENILDHETTDFVESMHNKGFIAVHRSIQAHVAVLPPILSYIDDLSVFGGCFPAQLHHYRIYAIIVQLPPIGVS